MEKSKIKLADGRVIERVLYKRLTELKEWIVYCRYRGSIYLVYGDREPFKLGAIII